MQFDICAHPYLADHIVQGTRLIAGADLVMAAINDDAFPPHANDICLQHIRFIRPLPLADGQPATCQLDIIGNDITLSGPDNGETIATMCIADSSTITSMQRNATTSNVQDMGKLITADTLYGALQERGNDYGLQFRTITELHVRGLSGVGRCDPGSHRHQQVQMALAIDACTHVAATLAELPSTYLLQEIEVLYLSGQALAGIATIRCEIVQNNSCGCTADVRIECGEPESGNSRLVAILRGLTLTLLSQPQVSAETDQAVADQANIAITGTFTLEPLAEFSRFWENQLTLPAGTAAIKTGAYSQVFHALLGNDPVFSGLARQHVCLLRLEDWLVTNTQQSASSLQPSPGTAQFAGVQTTELPNGQRVADINAYETHYLYQEIFVDLAYRRHGIALLDGDTVIDIGANIGIFSLFAAQQANDIRLVAVEPSPAVIEKLKVNLRAYVPDAIVVAAGAAQSRGEAEFTAYPHSSVFSSFSSNPHTDRQALRSIIRNSLQVSGDYEADYLEQAVDSLLAGRLDAEICTVPLLSVSDIIGENHLSGIGLLKIDAEKSEHAILAGINDEHWPLIEQLIIEVHTQDGGGLGEVTAMLRERGFVYSEDEEQLLGESGLVTVYASRPDRQARVAAASPLASLEKNAALYVDAIDSYQRRSDTPLETVICPCTSRDPVVNEAVEQIESLLIQQINTVTSTHALRWHELTECYPVSSQANTVGNQLGHIPYTRQWYAATATGLVRRQFAQNQAPLKVIALDCDNTLWSGVVAELGLHGITLTERHRALHRWVKQCISDGMLLCLVSKNAQEDVRGAFERQDLGLNWSDIAAQRINWQAKSQNLKELASELNLGLDAFLFLDDSPLECAEVRAACPQVLTVLLPHEDQDIENFLQHIWSLDKTAITHEDQQRNAMLRDERRRQQFRQTSTTLRSFVDGLELQLDIHAVTDAELQRIAQLTQRTNQFNLSSRRRSRDALARMLEQGYQCLSVAVKDRFGDYGLTGAALFITDSNNAALHVDTFLLSCRVLARGVEHALLAALGDLAGSQQLDTIILDYVPSARNEPAKRFLDSLPVQDAPPFGVSVAAARRCRYEPERTQASPAATEQPRAIDQRLLPCAQSELITDIATRFATLDAILAHNDAAMRRPRPALQTQLVLPKSVLEKSIAQIWCSVLNIAEVGIYDDYFELGGTSLSAVAVIGELQAELAGEVLVADLFDAPTIAVLAQSIENARQSGNTVSEQSQGRERGAARRQSRATRQRQ